MEYPLGQRLRELSGPMLLTGHTGFKGTWMTFLLEHLQIPVVGYSLPPEKDSLFESADRAGAIPEIFADIRDYRSLEMFMDAHEPSTIIHLAAQPLVLKSYENPRETFDVNVMGTVNVLDIAFKREYVKTIIVVTTDKVYRNFDEGRAFVESDPLGGKDPYSASKVGTESVVSAWQQLAKVTNGPNVISVRAGNVIGGGDLAENRLFPDIARSFLADLPVVIRNPNSTRPWQHVLDPLCGYLKVLELSLRDKVSTSYNFGPAEASISVIDVVRHIESKSEFFVKFLINGEISILESQTLQLGINQAGIDLNWHPKWPQLTAIDKTIDWWQGFRLSHTPKNLVLRDIRCYFDL